MCSPTHTQIGGALPHTVHCILNWCCTKSTAPLTHTAAVAGAHQLYCVRRRVTCPRRLHSSLNFSQVSQMVQHRADVCWCQTRGASVNVPKFAGTGLGVGRARMSAKIKFHTNTHQENSLQDRRANFLYQTV